MELVDSKVQFQDGGENVETVAMRKTDFDKLLFERKFLRVVVVVMAFMLLATSMIIWKVELQPRVMFVAPPSIQK